MDIVLRFVFNYSMFFTFKRFHKNIWDMNPFSKLNARQAFFYSDVKDIIQNNFFKRLENCFTSFVLKNRLINIWYHRKKSHNKIKANLSSILKNWTWSVKTFLQSLNKSELICFPQTLLFLFLLLCNPIWFFKDIYISFFFK